MSTPRHLLVLLVALLCLAACTAVNDGAAAPITTEVTRPPMLGFDDGADSGDLPGRPVDDDEAIRLALVRPTSWHPQAVSIADRGAAIVADLLYDGLTDVGPDDRLVPALALGWSASTDLAIWTFHLDPDRLTAADVVATFDGFEVAQPTPATSAVLDQIADVRAIDDETVEFVLKAPNGGFGWLLSGVAFSITDAVGTPTGRYGLSELAGGLELISSDSSPDLSIRWYATDELAEAAVFAGEADVALAADEPTSTAEVLVKESVRSVSRYLQVNERSPEVASDGVREALVSAVDAQVLAAMMGPLAASQRGLAVPSTVGAKGTLCETACVAGPATVDPLRRPLVVAGNERQSTLLVATAQQMSAAGVPAEAVVLTAAGLEAEVAGGTVDVFASGWVAEAPSLDGWLPLLATIDGIGSIRGEAIDDLVDQARREADDETRWGLLREAEAVALRTGLVVPVVARADAIVIRAEFGPIQIDPDGTIRFDR